MRVGTLKQKHTHSATGEIKFWRRVQCACWIVRLDLILQAQGYRVGHFSVNISYLQSSHELLSKQRRRVWKVRVQCCVYIVPERKNVEFNFTSIDADVNHHNVGRISIKISQSWRNDGEIAESSWKTFRYFEHV